MTSVALTIAGSDPSGGAGVQADLKTFHQHGVYGASVITLLTVQNTRGVSRVAVMDPSLVREQLEAVVADLPPAAAKTGALGTAAIVEVVADAAERLELPLVVDPVMISKHGAPLVDEAARVAIRERLLPRATLVTPNAPEASWLAGFDVVDRHSAREAAQKIAELGAWAVLLKGGHLGGAQAVDYLWINGQIVELSAPRIDSPHTHGTGCTYSAAITARLALAEPLLTAVSDAKGWLTEAILAPPRLPLGARAAGARVGPVNHFTPVSRRKSVPPEPR
ncbi:MAG: bifunctional hydroxymethylpyrimidine kinase/phosphomethylpyrimidine kinase [Sandaracinaceae bacterium]|nr:bifunctional hydroxymethylpyrimidine kinase/phosphomethylpyrimidine kinase [Sandaracinaceae bacterium]